MSDLKCLYGCHHIMVDNENVEDTNEVIRSRKSNMADNIMIKKDKQ